MDWDHLTPERGSLDLGLALAKGLPSRTAKGVQNKEGMLHLCRVTARQKVCATALRHLYTEMDGNITHDEKNQLFFVRLNEGGGRAVLEYDKIDDNALDFYHTGVPTTHRGQGIAKHLVKAGFDYVFEKNLKVKPSCTYVQKYVQENLKEVEIEKFIAS